VQTRDVANAHCRLIIRGHTGPATSVAWSPDGRYVLVTHEGDTFVTVYDAKNRLVREYSSKEEKREYPPANVPDYWFGEEAVLPTKAGLNRFVWDMRYPAPK